jgi:formylglycine-generating enzyme required for sulfatase activity
MNNKSSLTLLFFVFLSAFVQGRTLAPETLYMLNYSQRQGTKLVDVSYELNLQVGQTAEVSFSFSHDDGATFPVRCVSVTGHVGPGQTSGGKMVVWDAGGDWPRQFTDRGRIQATCVIEDKRPPANPIIFDVAEITFKASNIEESPSWWIKNYHDGTLSPVASPIASGIPSTPPRKFYADKYEVTNFQWNEVVDWARNKGYDLQPVPYASGEENLPRTNVAMKEVVKWLNARSEMEGKTPVFYVDPMELGWDENGDGKLSAGTDSMWLSPEEEMQMMNGTLDWSLIANPGKGKQEGWIQWDPNFNGQWDSGEPFVDRNRNGKFEPQEYNDINGNGRRDLGQTIVCRTGDISGWFHNYAPTNASMNMMWGWHIDMHLKQAANGYRLPMGLWPCGRDDFRFLAMGGKTEQGSYQTWEDWMNPGTMDPITGEWKQPMKTGIRYVEEWPWGKESPENKADISQYAVTPYGSSPASGIQPVGGRKPNGYGLHDMIGNVAELSMEWYINLDPATMDLPGINPLMCNALGGSFKRLRGVDNFMMGAPPQNWDGAMSPGSVMSSGQYVDAMGSPEVGFRAIRLQF